MSTLYGRRWNEYDASGQSPTIPHIWRSVSRSILGLMTGIVADSYGLDVDRPIAERIPDVVGTAYDSATIRDALDMRVGIRFDEDHHARNGAIVSERRAPPADCVWFRATWPGSVGCG